MLPYSGGCAACRTPAGPATLLAALTSAPPLVPLPACSALAAAVVDNLPQVGPEKYDKLTAILSKIFSGSGRIREGGLFHPVSQRFSEHDTLTSDQGQSICGQWGAAAACGAAAVCPVARGGKGGRVCAAVCLQRPRSRSCTDLLGQCSVSCFQMNRH